MTTEAAYPFWMAAAVVVGLLLAALGPRPAGLTIGERSGIAIGAFCGAMIGAKLPFVLAEPAAWDGLAVWFSDGKTILTGLVGGYAGVEAAKWSLGVRSKTGDAFAVPVPAAIAVGRLACFSGGCCFGTATALPWAVDFGDGTPRHPTQLYEAAFHAGAALVLARLRARGVCRGQLFKLYLIAYFAYRFGSEFLRPEPVVLVGLTAYQWLALALTPAFVLLWRRDREAGPLAAAA